jgi:hypothetical protein
LTSVNILSITPIQTALLIQYGWDVWFEVHSEEEYNVITSSRIPGRISEYCQDVTVAGEDYFWVVRADEDCEWEIMRKLKEADERIQHYVKWINARIGITDE